MYLSGGYKHVVVLSYFCCMNKVKFKSFKGGIEGDETNNLVELNFFSTGI